MKLTQSTRFVLFTTLLASTAVVAADKTTEKHLDDPTRIMTKVGAGYDGELTFNGSIGLDETRMLRGQINADGSEWQLGGSWLFDKGILNAYLNGHEQRNTYNLGTYVSLSLMGVDTGKWMVFPMAGVTFVDGKKGNDNSTGAYLGAFAIRPINAQWSAVTYAGGSIGSNSYSSLWLGAGASYKITSKHSVRLMGSYSDDNYRTDNKVSFSYNYEL
ncbi:hypothetical protein [Shewanella youngdeokensis]|uniref:Outer membrane protein beta-barrel domain-containing protein n=1 Tax=Shewanella youngdeokensis TaxID=2999068 RepID=A0ABZ0K2S5_9GAMM|nr:hypothetical protein RGE70_09040 [Shewanella sp. DAU334]